MDLMNDGVTIGRIVTSGVSLPRVEAMVLALARHKHGEDDPKYAEIKEVVAKVRTAREKRSEVIHSLWVEAEGEGERRELFLRREGFVEYKTSLDEIRSVAQEIADVLRAVLPLMARQSPKVIGDDSEMSAENWPSITTPSPLIFIAPVALLSTAFIPRYSTSKR
jgi:hypothetical protein